MGYDCNREPNLARCIKCPSHCECEAESEEFTSRDFGTFRAGFNAGYKEGKSNGVKLFMLKAINAYYEDHLNECEIHNIVRSILCKEDK